MTPWRSLLFLLAIGTVLAATSAPQVTSPPPVLSIHTDLVTLPVTVVDPQGGFVTGLQRDHFTVYDNAAPQAIEFFASEDLPVTVGLVIDSSGSMRTRRDDVTAAMTAFARLSHPLDEFFTVNFNDYVWLGLPASFAFTEDRNQLHDALTHAPAIGRTALYDGITRALDHVQTGTRERRALIVVSDGGDNASVQTLDDVVHHARMASVPIYAVTLFDGDDHEAKPQVLKTLARETGGRAFTPHGGDKVMSAFAAIARELRAVYTIGFVPSETDAAAFHLVRVDVDSHDGRHLTARTRVGYYARPRSGTQ